MFTSRAEYRLILRADNADQRLTENGIALGVVGSERTAAFRAKMAALGEGLAWILLELNATPQRTSTTRGSTSTPMGFAAMSRICCACPEVDLARLATIWPELAALQPAIAEQIEIDARYAGYLERQEADIRSFRRDESLLLPDDLDYGEIGSLSTEVRQALTRARPTTLGAASRIPGVTPAALAALLRHVRRRKADVAPPVEAARRIPDRVSRFF